VLADAPELGRRRRRVVEDPEQRQRVARAVVGEVAFGQPQAQGDAAHQALPQFRQRSHVFEYDRSQFDGSCGKQVRPVQGSVCLHERVIGGELLAEVQALFLIGAAGGEFVADAKVSAPRPAAATHFDAHFLRGRTCEKLARHGLQVSLQARIDAVTDDVKESALPRRGVELDGRLLLVNTVLLSTAACERRNVNDRQ
jgi:hypothetical protein